MASIIWPAEIGRGSKVTKTRRLIKVAKWTGAAVFVLVSAIWATSTSLRIYGGASWSIDSQFGDGFSMVVPTARAVPNQSTVTFRPTNPIGGEWSFWPELSSIPPGVPQRFSLVIPYWLIAALALSIACAGHALDRRIAPEDEPAQTVTRRQRILKASKWTAVAIALATVGMWAYGVLNVPGQPGPLTWERWGRWTLMIVVRPELLFSDSNEVFRGEHTWRSWKFSVDSHPSKPIKYILVPYWLLAVVPSFGAVVLFAIDRRRTPPGHCRKCGYDLRGAVSDRCSECGTEIISGATR